MKKWKRYQQEIADLFMALGCKAATENSVQGARAKHCLDVWVIFSHFGIDQPPYRGAVCPLSGDFHSD